MMKIANEALAGDLTRLADEWDAVRAHQQARGKDSTLDVRGSSIWWHNQHAYAGERFVVALIDDLLEARGLPPRSTAEQRLIARRSVSAAYQALLDAMPIDTPITVSELFTRCRASSDSRHAWSDSPSVARALNLMAHEGLLDHVAFGTFVKPVGVNMVDGYAERRAVTNAPANGS
jgi:hypothetical protein